MILLQREYVGSKETKKVAIWNASCFNINSVCVVFGVMLNDINLT